MKNLQKVMCLVLLLVLLKTTHGFSQQTGLPELIPYRKGKQWGYCDKNKKMVIPIKYDYAGLFKEGLAAVRLKDTWGFIDKEGKDAAPVVGPVKGLDAVINREGGHFFTFKKKVGIPGKTGKEIVPVKYVEVLDAGEGLFAVNRGGKYHFDKRPDIEGGKWGFVDTAGNEVITVKYQEVRVFSEGLAAVKEKGKWGFIDTKGNEVIAAKYEDAGYYGGIGVFSEGLAVVKIKGQWGYIDKTGNEVIPPKYEQTGYFGVLGKDLARVEIKKKVGVIDKTGKEIVPIKYVNVVDVGEGLFAVNLGGTFHPDKEPPVVGGKWGFLGTAGNEVIPVKYNNVRAFHEELAAVKVKGKWGFIDKEGKEIVPVKYDEVIYPSKFVEHTVHSFYTFVEVVSTDLFYDVSPSLSGVLIVTLKGKWGLVDTKTGKEVIPPVKYKCLRVLGSGLVGICPGTISKSLGFLSLGTTAYKYTDTEITGYIDTNGVEYFED